MHLTCIRAAERAHAVFVRPGGNKASRGGLWPQFINKIGSISQVDGTPKSRQEQDKFKLI